MVTPMGGVTLRGGSVMTITMVEPPQEDVAQRLLHFLEHKDNDSYRGIRQRLEGMYASHCLDRYFIGEVEGRIVGHVWYGLPRGGAGEPTWGVGNFGHVYTEPEWRGQGIASEIVRVLVDHFNAEPQGKCLLCSASAQSGRIYRKYGFEFIPPTAESGAMGLVKGETFAELEQRYFAPDRPVHVREGHVGHRHDVDRMMDFSPAWIEARRHWHPAFLSSSVPTYMAALHKVEDGRGLLTVLQTEDGSVLGYATVLNLGSPYEANLRTLDFAVHPHYLDQAGTLLTETLTMAQQEGLPRPHAFVAACDESKLAALREAGFSVSHTFTGAFVLGGTAHDLLMLQS
ncbi:GNAT family N-acetyltransferase [bacterium]|nr:GNAT family N-acetyltransferase [bacterium]